MGIQSIIAQDGLHIIWGFGVGLFISYPVLGFFLQT